jgi:hypothetical protein
MLNLYGRLTTPAGEVYQTENPNTLYRLQEVINADETRHYRLEILSDDEKITEFNGPASNIAHNLKAIINFTFEEETK